MGFPFSLLTLPTFRKRAWLTSNKRIQAFWPWQRPTYLPIRISGPLGALPNGRTQEESNTATQPDTPRSQKEATMGERQFSHATIWPPQRWTRGFVRRYVSLEATNTYPPAHWPPNLGQSQFAADTLEKATFEPFSMRWQF